MKVKEVIKVLERCDSDAEVFISMDDFGKEYSPLYEVNRSFVYAHLELYSDVFDTRYRMNHYNVSDKEWKLIRRTPRCVVLFPL
jgi:hypothetical protein